MLIIDIPHPKCYNINIENIFLQGEQGEYL